MSTHAPCHCARMVFKWKFSIKYNDRDKLVHFDDVHWALPFPAASLFAPVRQLGPQAHIIPKLITFLILDTRLHILGERVSFRRHTSIQRIFYLFQENLPKQTMSIKPFWNTKPKPKHCLSYSVLVQTMHQWTTPNLHRKHRDSATPTLVMWCTAPALYTVGVHWKTACSGFVDQIAKHTFYDGDDDKWAMVFGASLVVRREISRTPYNSVPWLIFHQMY